MSENRNIGPEYFVTEFSIRNFKGIKSLDITGLPNKTNWIFLTGENGYGKTSILQGLAFKLYGKEEHTFKCTADSEISVGGEFSFKKGNKDYQKKQEKSIFISHEKQDSVHANKIYSHLKIKGFSPWMETDILPGQNWEKEIKKAIEKSGIFIYVIPQKSNQSKKFEIMLALEKQNRMISKDKVFIIPIMFGGRAFPAFLKDIVPAIFSASPSGLNALTEALEDLKESNPSSFEINDQPILKEICCYGSARLNRVPEDFNERISPTKSLFKATFLYDIEHQLSRWYFKKDEFPEFKMKYESVTLLLVNLLGISKITIDKTDVVWYHEKDEDENNFPPLTSNNLAAGYRSLISMVGDMILRLFETQPNIHDPKDLVGIVIIDELDLHLHPKWQKKLPTLLSSIFPKVQFIASTHSPIPLLGAPDGSVFLRVNRTAEEGITIERLEDLEKEISNLLPNSILTSPIFGMTEIFPITHKSDEDIRTEDFYAEIKINDLTEKRIDEYFTEEKEEELLDFFKSQMKAENDSK